MNFLKQIITLLSQYEQKIDVFNEQELENTAFERLYTGVKSGKYSSDTEAALDIYRTEHTDARYRNLKSRLKRKLSNNLFFMQIEHPEHPESLAAKLEIERQLFAMKILAALGSTKAAYEIATQILPVTQKYHFTNATIECLQLLLEQVSYSGDKRDYQTYIKLLNKYLQILDAEINASDQIEFFKTIFTSSKSISPDILPKLENTVQSVTTLWQKHQSFSVFLKFFRLNLYFHQLKG